MNRRTQVRHRIGLFADLLPIGLKQILYQIPYAIGAIYLRHCTSARIWARNSLVTKRIVPAVSDIDLTAYFDDQAKPDQIKEFVQNFRRLKSRLWLFGEVNIYQEAWLEMTLKHINTCELHRDPILQSQLNLTPRQATPIEKAIFLMRLLESDFETLSQWPRNRRAKWSGHFRDLQLAIPTPITVDSVLGHVERLLNIPARDEFVREMKFFFSLRHPKFQRQRLEAQAEYLPWTWSFFPQHLCPPQNTQSSLNPLQLEIQAKSYSWEIFGALTQSANFPPETFTHHLENIRTRVRQRGDRRDLEEDLTKTLSFLRNRKIAE